MQDQNTPTTAPYQPPKRTNLLIGVVILILFAGILLYMRMAMKSSTAPEVTITPSVIPTERETTGSFSLISSSAAALKVGVPVTLTVTADTAGKDVVGYDIVIAHNTAQVGTLSVKSLIPAFQVFTKESIDHVTVTGIKGLGSKESNIFSNTPILEVTFTPEKAGPLGLSVVEDINKESTKFVDVGTQLYFPKLTNSPLQVTE